ncbi:MAG: glycosyltransferase [Acetobacter sp.]|uniref:glycosyltransferase family 32 protein n=1 Tax=Acetobacter sp. TaxID=440 RepID=UPI0039E776D9
MTDTPQTSVILTHLGTVLCRAPSGVLFHCLPDEAPQNDILSVTDTTVRTRQGQTNLIAAPRDDAPETLCIRHDTHYLCAEPGGAVTLRDAVSVWETFRSATAGDALTTPDMQVHERRPTPKRRLRRISRTIHQIGNSSTLPEIFLQNVAHLQRLNPGWSYRYWGEKERHDFIYDHYGWDILRRYLSINPRYGAARADLFRYLCIYQLGGVYLDIKSSANQPFETMINDNDDYLLSQWKNSPTEAFSGWGLGPEIGFVAGGEYQQWHIMAAAGHPFLASCIETVLTRIDHYTPDLYGTGRLGVLRVTGPYAYTFAIYKMLEQHSHRFIDSERSGLLYSYVQNHTHFFGRHYSQESLPLVL